MAAEDFGEFGRAGVPSFMFWLGATAPEKYASVHGDVTLLPGLHSSLFAPDREPTLKTGAAALAVAAMELLKKP
jgi:hippurate hydrolase